MSEIDLKINIDEANLILEALGQMPFARVYTLVSKLQNQATTQLKDVDAASAGITKLDTKSVAEA